MTATGKTVLIVEDDARLNRMVKYALMAKGCKVETAMNGIDALEVLKESIPDAIVLDLMMPEMDGFELSERLQKDSQYKDIPIIIMSALEEDNNKDKLKSMGPRDYIEKPFNVKDFAERVLKSLAF